MAATIALVVALILSTAQGMDRDHKWARKISDVLNSMDDVTTSFRKLNDETNFENIEELVEKLQDLPSQLTGINKLNLDAPELDRAEFRKLMDQSKKPIVSESFRNKNLESNYVTRGLGFMLTSNDGYQGLRCIMMLYSPPHRFKGYKLPIQKMCRYVKEDLNKPRIYDFSTDKICKGTDACSGDSTPYPYGDEKGTSVQDACTEDNKCDVEKALPMMGALLWYRLSAFVASSLCSNYDNQPDEGTLDREHKDIANMADVIALYASTLHWKEFFIKAIQVRAYSQLPEAMELVKGREKSIERTAAACTILNSAAMCTIGDIYKEYQSLLKLKNDHDTPQKTRVLRLYAKIDHAKMINLKQDAVRHIDLLGNIRSLDENLQTAVTGISKYFSGLADYDKGIAEADVIFLSDKLNEYKTKSEELAQTAEQQIRTTMEITLTATTLQLLEETALLTLKIAENLNPLTVIFGGVEPGDIYEQTGAVAAAAAKETRAIAVAVRFSDVWKDSLILTQDFYNNAAQISKMHELVKAIESNTKLDTISFDATKFVKEYGAYTPKVDRSRLAANDALWAAYKDSACELLFSSEGALSAVPQGVAGGMLLCENLEGTLAELAALRENIFDFQFDLVDALARVVRGIVAKTLSESITVSNDLLDASQLMLGFFMTQYRLQSQASLYCDKLEYRNRGRRVSACSNPPDGFFSSHRLDQLIAYEVDTNYHVDERFVYIPTRAQFQGDKGFIDLPALAKGKSVLFQLPANRTWLEEYNWLDPGLTLAPFVESFKLYLPRKTYPTDSNRRHSKTSISLKSTASSFVSVESDVAYYLPLDEGVFKTFYDEGYSRCTKSEIDNPYSLCNNLPDICDTTQRVTGQSMLPTILSTWKLEYNVYSGRTKLEWDAPNPATNLLLIAKVKLRFDPRANNKRRLTSPQLDGQPVPGCCKSGNEYRPEWNRRTCQPCPSRPEIPTDATSNLGGYYCEIDD